MWQEICAMILTCWAYRCLLLTSNSYTSIFFQTLPRIQGTHLEMIPTWYQNVTIIFLEWVRIAMEYETTSGLDYTSSIQLHKHISSSNGHMKQFRIGYDDNIGTMSKLLKYIETPSIQNDHDKKPPGSATLRTCPTRAPRMRVLCWPRPLQWRKKCLPLR